MSFPFFPYQPFPFLPKGNGEPAHPDHAPYLKVEERPFPSPQSSPASPPQHSGSLDLSKKSEPKSDENENFGSAPNSPSAYSGRPFFLKSQVFLKDDTSCKIYLWINCLGGGARGPRGSTITKIIITFDIISPFFGNQKNK